MKLNKALLSATAVALLVPSFATAATDTANFQVTAEVQASCVIASADDLAFGQIVAGSDQTASGNIVWSCTNGTSGDLSLDGGQSTDITNRAMAAATTGTDLSYQLFTDAAFTSVFGDGTDGVTVNHVGTGIANTISTTVHAQILESALAVVEPDTFSDTIQVTVTF